MIIFQLIFSVLSVGGLAWRMLDPSGSYDAIFHLAEGMASFLPGGFVVARAAGLLIADQFVGFLFGMGFASSVYLTFFGLKLSLSSVFQRERIKAKP